MLFYWFFDIFFQANPNKCHLLISKDENVALKNKNETITHSSNHKLLGILFNSNLILINMLLHYAGRPPRS